MYHKKKSLIYNSLKLKISTKFSNLAIAFLNVLWYPKNTENTKGNRKGAEKKFFGIYLF